MKRKLPVVLLGICISALTPQLAAQANYGLHEKGIERLNAAREIAPISIDSAFGDSISLFNGGGEFSNTDISIPGNSGLSVSLSRSLVIDDRSRLNGLHRGGFGEWDLDLPSIHAVIGVGLGWRPAGGTVAQRCSLPSELPSSATIAPEDYWDGYKMHIPGAGTQTMLAASTSAIPSPSDGTTYPWITKSFWRIGCKASSKNGYAGQAFVALSPTGEKYHFDWAVVRSHSGVKSEINSGILSRQAIFFLVSRIEDRSGNWVNYTYSGEKLTGITSNDGRYINLSWSGNNITSASSSVGSWSFGYSGTKLASVNMPDGSRWTYASSGALAIYPGAPSGSFEDPSGCPEVATDPTGAYGLTISNPSGATATYNFGIIFHGRSNIPEHACYISSPQYWFMKVPRNYSSLTLLAKSVTGPGLSTMNWTYSYGQYDPLGDGNTTVNAISGPANSYTRRTFGIGYNLNEGQLLRVETGSGPASILSVEETRYMTSQEVVGQPFPSSAGEDPRLWGDLLSTQWLRPIKVVEKKQNGTTYTRTTTAFDQLARPLTITSNSTPGP